MKAIHIVLITTVVLVILTAGRLYTSNADFSMGNPYWNGLSGFYESKTVIPLYHLSDLPEQDASNTTLLIVSPVYHYGQNDSAPIEAYLKRGGHLVVMDDFGESDSLLTALDSSIQIKKLPLCQDDKYFQSPSLPILTNISNSGITAGVGQIYTNNPVALALGDDTDILATTTSKAWLDIDRSGTFDKGEYFSTYPVIASENYGDGSLTVIADPDIFINSMMDRGDNNRLASNIFNGNIMYVDLSHGPGIPPLISAFYAIRYNIATQLLCVLAIILVFFNSYVLVKRFTRTTPEEAVERVSRRQKVVDFMEQKHHGRSDEKSEMMRKL